MNDDFLNSEDETREEFFVQQTLLNVVSLISLNSDNCQKVEMSEMEHSMI
jgi:hypothetical protein